LAALTESLHIVSIILNKPWSIGNMAHLWSLEDKTGIRNESMFFDVYPPGAGDQYESGKGVVAHIGGDVLKNRIRAGFFNRRKLSMEAWSLIA